MSERGAGGAADVARSSSRILRYAGGAWPDVEVKTYKDGPGDFQAITRRLLAAPERAAFEVRYFELGENGRSSHERHEHVHVVICMRGRGRVRLSGREESVGPGDVVCIAAGEPHQFRNAGAEPFGFFCIVDRERDRPIPVGD